MRRTKSVRRLLTIGSLVAALAVAAGAQGVAASPVRSCGSVTVGGAAVTTSSSGAGAACMLGAFRSCTPATYQLASFGVDTIATSTFMVAKGPNGCTVTVSVTHRVVPRPPSAPTVGRCGAIVRAGLDIVATGCRPAPLLPILSLTGRPRD
jgi:hypothetical protein